MRDFILFVPKQISGWYFPYGRYTRLEWAVVLPIGIIIAVVVIAIVIVVVIVIIPIWNFLVQLVI